MKVPPKILKSIYLILYTLIILDIVLLGIVFAFPVSDHVLYTIENFDVCLCIILLIEFAIKLRMSWANKRIFLKENWIDLIASIPFDLILPMIFSSLRFLRIIRILRLIRMGVLFKRGFDELREFFENEYFGKLITYVFISVMICSLAVYLIHPGFDFYSSLWYVIITFLQAEYVDSVPSLRAERILSVILVLIGFTIFSSFTGILSTFFTTRILKTEEYSVEDELEDVYGELKEIKGELEKSRQDNEDLKREISELKQIMLDKND